MMHSPLVRAARTSSGLALTLSVAACAPAHPPEARAPQAAEMNAEALLAELNPRGGAALVQAWSGTDPEAVAIHYSDDAVLVVDGQTVYRGRTEILNGFLRPLVGTVSALTPTVEHVVGGPEQMTLIGRFTTRVSSPDGASHDAAGVFGNTWARQPDGSWKIEAAVNDRPSAAAGARDGARGSVPGETVRIVRFNVKPDQRVDFERFFREDLMTAAAKRQGIPVEQLDLGGLRLLIPSATNAQGYLTYYILVDAPHGALGTAEVMRDMVREAFPGEDGIARVRRWMATMVLEEPFTPEGETFTEADLRSRTLR